MSHETQCTKVLGPGKRYALWTQGCRKRCKGCVFPEGQSLESNGYHIGTEELVRRILGQAQNLTGVTISGGEPFLQAASINELILEIRRQSGLDIMIYSGYTLAELRAREDAAIESILANVDLLVDGEYVEEQNTNSIYRGSDNQVIHFLSDKYLPFRQKILGTKNRSLEFEHKGEELFMVGLPAKGFMKDFYQRIAKGERR